MPGAFPISPEVANWSDVNNDLTSMYSTNITCGNGVKSNWVQLIASTPADTEFLVLDVQGSQNSSLTSLFDLGIGALNNEVPIISNLFTCGNTGSGSVLTTPILPISIPGGTRIVGRAQAVGAAEGNGPILRLADGSWGSSGGYAGVEGLGADLVNSRGTQVTSGASTGVKGSWTQIVGSTPRDYDGFFLCMGPQTSAVATTYNMNNIDVGIGPSGGEIILVPDIFSAQYNAIPDRGIAARIYWTPIPAGSRLSVRFSCGGTASALLCFTINGIYK